MMPGENAAPMHPYCRCSVAAWEDSDDYEAWLDFLDKGGTTKEWEKLKDFVEKEESKKKYKHKNTVINKSVIKDTEYRKKFTSITKENKISRSLWSNAMDMLDHRSGTKFEDIAFIDSKTGSSLINKNYNKEKSANPSKKMKTMLKKADPYTIISIHNHPESFAPSFADLVVCKNRKYKFGVVACHNGIIYKYSVDKDLFNAPMAMSALDRLDKDGYTENIIMELKDAGVKMEVY